MKGLVASCGIAASLAALSAEVVVRPQDNGAALVNPGMGLVHYHYSNRLWAYGLDSKVGDTEPLPGTSVVYFRVLWSDVEPHEGEYRWDLFDSVAQNWIKAGKKIAFRIICCNQTANATPDWVREAGAKGIWFKYRSETAELRWEPAYDDPVFLGKYSAFLKAFAARYDGDPSVAFVDIGSFGMYGEGHTGDTSKLSRQETWRIAELHMRLHRKLLPRTYLLFSDDMVSSTSKDVGLPLLATARSLGIGLRDDSLMCDENAWYHDNWGPFFAASLPVVLETGHYSLCSARGHWRRDRILESVEKHQASYFAFHGFPDDFRVSHAAEIAAVNRRLGYRLRPTSVSFPAEVSPGEPVKITSEWVNAGVAPCLPGGFVSWSLLDASGNVCWSFTDEDFDVRALAPTLEDGPRAAKVVSCGRFGFTAPIPPWNDAVLKDLREHGRVLATSHELLKPGAYSLCVSVGSRQGTPVIALPLDDVGGRRYKIGNVVVRGVGKDK